MKKMNILLSSLALAAAMITPFTSSAAVGFKDNINSFEVSKKYDSTYEVTIPAGTTDLKAGQTFDVSATSTICFDSTLTVSVESEHNWHLKDEKHDENNSLASYKMKFGDTPISEQSADILIMPYDKHEGTVTLTVMEVKTPEYAGTYKDTLTFKVKIDGDDAVEIPKNDVPEVKQDIDNE